MNTENPPPDAEVRETEEVMQNEQLPLPVAVRNDEITEEDFVALTQKAEEARASGEPSKAPPRKIAEGRRVPVRGRTT